MIHHYITHYEDCSDSQHYVVSWLQLNIFGRCFCFSERKVRL
jgi:hypothetical protein